MDLTAGPRFHALLPLGNRANLDHDIAYLSVRTSFSYTDIMQMPSSRRHRLVCLFKAADKQQEINNSARPGGGKMSRPASRSKSAVPRRR